MPLGKELKTLPEGAAKCFAFWVGQVPSTLEPTVRRGLQRKGLGVADSNGCHPKAPQPTLEVTCQPTSYTPTSSSLSAGGFPGATGACWACVAGHRAKKSQPPERPSISGAQESVCKCLGSPAPCWIIQGVSHILCGIPTEKRANGPQEKALANAPLAVPFSLSLSPLPLPSHGFPGIIFLMNLLYPVLVFGSAFGRTKLRWWRNRLLCEEAAGSLRCSHVPVSGRCQDGRTANSRDAGQRQ